MTEDQTLYQIATVRRAVVDTVLNLEALATLARCPNEQVVQAVLDLAEAEIASMRDPGLRRLAIGEGGHG